MSSLTGLARTARMPVTCASLRRSPRRWADVIDATVDGRTLGTASGRIAEGAPPEHHRVRSSTQERRDEEKKAFRMKGEVLGEQKTKPSSPISKGGGTTKDKGLTETEVRPYGGHHKHPTKNLIRIKFWVAF